MRTVCRMGLSFGLSLGVGVLVLSAAIPVKVKAQTPFLGPVPTPVCQPGDRTEKGVDGQLTSAERTSGDRKSVVEGKSVYVGGGRVI